MRNVWRIFRDDLRLSTSNIVVSVVVVALCIVPVLFAWFNIAGSWDPGANTSQLKVAVANSDEGYESDLVPIKLNVGDRVVDTLRENDDYGWVFVDEDAALDGVRSGEYYAAIVIPKDFSAKMMSVLSSSNERASVGFYQNAKENPAAPVFADVGGAEAIEDIRAKFSDAVEEMSLGLASDLVTFASGENSKGFGTRLVARLGDVADSLDASATQVRMFSDLAGSASSLVSSTAKTLTGSSDAADASIGVIGEATEALDASIASAQSAANAIEQQVEAASSDGEIDKVGTEAATQLANDVSTLATSVASISRQTETVAQTLQETTEGLAGSNDSMSSELDDVHDELGTAANKLGASAAKIRKFQDDIAAAIARGDISTVATIVRGNTASMAQWLASPVEVEKRAIYPIENYGSSMASFYTVLAIWIGAVLLAALMKTGVSEARLRRYEEEAGRPVKGYERYLGRYLIFALIALVQATVLALGNLFCLHVQCVNPLLFIAACWVCALVFGNIVYTLAVSFGNIGKALCIIMLAMPLVGLDGEFPIQMMGDIFQVVYPLMPFTYGMSALQASIAGVFGNEYLVSLLLLSAFLVASLLLGLAARRPLMRLADYCGAKLEKTGLM